MNLFILRHGLAVEPGTPGYDDSERPLTSEGKSKLKAIAAAMVKLELDFDLILSSPYTRARQTAEIVAERLKASDKLELTKLLEPQGSFKDLINAINKHKSAHNVLLVGHEPYLSELISLLVYGDNNASVVLKKGGFARLGVPTLRADRCGLLEWLLTPKQMGFIAG